MTEFNWDLAPEGAVELRTEGYTCRFFNAEGKMYIYGGAWSLSSSPSDWTTIATRPAPSEPSKTVEDAVKAFPDGWPDVEYEYLYWNDEMGYVYRDRYLLSSTYHLVCTREQYEACVKAKGGDQWAHIDAFGEKCIISIDEPDVGGRILIFKQSGWFALVAPSLLQPIEKSKPTITKVQAWDMLMARRMNSAEVNTIKQQYDII